ncbi:MAG: hypothetical protein IH845_00570 [Nanoarchaeota archaeon]|nr:hypothetical protein [Nanoarchaeota archaeon]
MKIDILIVETIKRIFIIGIFLTSLSMVYAQSINITNPLGDVNITAGNTFNIDWTGEDNDHHKIGYSTDPSAACSGSSGSSGEVTGWNLICHQSSCSSPKNISLELNSSTVRVKVTGHNAGHTSISVDCSDFFTIASIPSVPTNLISSVINITATNLSWDAELSSELVSKYLIFRDSINIANTTDNNTLSYLDTGLNSSLYYNYTIRKNNPIGDSSFSNSVNVSTSADVTAPGIISNLTAIEIGDNHIFWNWTNPNNEDFNHTLIYRNGVFLTNVYSPNSSYNMTGLATNTPYTISIRTVDNLSNVNSTYVNLSATTTGSSGGDPDPGGGGGESVTVSSPNGGETLEPSSSHDIIWSSSNIDHFEIYYSTNSGSSWTLLQSHPYGNSSTISYSWTLQDFESSTMRVRVDGHDEDHVVKATDSSNSDFSITTSSTSGGGSGSGGGGTESVSETTEVAPTIWTKTYEEDDTELSEKVFVEKVLGEKESVNVKINGETHTVGVVELTETTALIEVSSTPQQVTLNIGEEKKFEVTNDSYYDILVSLNNITNGKADISIIYIHEKILEPSQLFNIKFELEENTIKSIFELVAIVTFENFGTVATPVNLTFIILDEEGREVYREVSNITLEVEEVLRWDYGYIEILPEGKYIAILETLYDLNVSDEFKVEFEISENGFFSLITGNVIKLLGREGRWWLSLVVGLWITCVIFILIKLRKSKIKIINKRR